jgi:hypothetical protein
MNLTLTMRASYCSEISGPFKDGKCQERDLQVTTPVASSGAAEPRSPSGKALDVRSRCGV